MKRISLLLLLSIASYNAFAVEKSSSQTQLSASIQPQASPQITSQVVIPIAPQEAIAACSGLYEKDSCQFHKNNTLLNGTCKILPSGNNNYELGCQPEQSTKNAAVDPATSGNSAKEPHQHKHKRG